jgi:hypothetical protein
VGKATLELGRASRAVEAGSQDRRHLGFGYVP